MRLLNLMPATSENKSSQQGSMGLKSRLSTLLNRLPKKIIISLLLVIILVFSIHWLVDKSRQRKASSLNNEATALLLKGDYGSAVGKLIDAYNSETRPIVKAKLAYNVGVAYFDDNNVEQGKKWIELASSIYTNIGDKQRADNTDYQLTQLIAAHQKVNNAQIQQNAKDRNVQDSNL